MAVATGSAQAVPLEPVRRSPETVSTAGTTNVSEARVKNRMRERRTGCGKSVRLYAGSLPFASLDLVAQELEPVLDVHDAGLLRMQTDTKPLVQGSAMAVSNGQFSFLETTPGREIVFNRRKCPKKPVISPALACAESGRNTILPTPTGDACLPKPLMHRMVTTLQAA
jgi:hypothetical protein